MTIDGLKLSGYLTSLISSGRGSFSREEAQRALNLTRRSFLDNAERQQRNGRLISPRTGFYVIVPEQYLSWGAPPPTEYIDPLMQFEHCTYYVGLLKAAELHGATHQAVMEFQVVAEKRLPRIRAGRSVIVFHYRKKMEALQTGIEKRKTDTGYMNVSTIELTALDLLRYPHAAAGLDNIATVIADLGSRIVAEKLRALIPAFERTVIQRLGYLLETCGQEGALSVLRAALLGARTLPWIELEPVQAKGDTGSNAEPLERNERWHVIVRRQLERDE